MATVHEDVCVLLQGTREVVPESSQLPIHCCLCWQQGQKVFPKLKCKADSLFGRAVNKSPLLFLFYFFSSYFSGGLCPFITLSVLLSPGRGRKPNMTDPSFLEGKLSQKPQHIHEIQYFRESPTTLMLKPFIDRLHETVCCATLRTSNNPLIYSIYTYNNKPPF